MMLERGIDDLRHGLRKVQVAFTELPYNVVKDFTDENLREIQYCPEMDLHISCDFNVDPMAWVLAHKTDDKVFYFDEIVMENTLHLLCNYFRRLLP